MALPLTKRHCADDELYTRRVKVEAEIDALLALPAAERQRRATIGNGVAGWISDEALVHLVRDAMRQGDGAARDALMRLLFIRCQQRLKLAMPDKAFQNAGHLRDEVLGRFGELVASDGHGDNPDRLDYYEVNFAHAFKNLRTDVRREQDRALGRDVQLPDDQETEGDDPIRKDRVSRRAEELTMLPALQESLQNARDLDARLEGLNNKERKAVVLQAMGYPQHALDPTTETIAKKCGVSERTVYNWLKSADEKLGLMAKEDE